jgi:predicted Zn finger-like uncharacterized protein
MIIECDKCGTKFNLKESLLKKGGTKVKCSKCKNVFTAYLPEERSVEEAETVPVRTEDLKSTMAIDSSPFAGEEAKAEAEKEKQGVDFEDVFEESMEDLEKSEPLSNEELQSLLQVEPTEEEKPDEEPSPEDDVTQVAPEEKAGDEAEDARETPGPVSAPKRSGRFPLLLIILVIILGLVGAAIAIFFWAPEMIPDSLLILKPVKKQVAVDSGIRRLKFPSVKGSFVDSKEAGQLFVIQGTVKNDYPKSRSFILIKGKILDEGGRPLKMKMAYAGNAMVEKELEALPLDDINKGMKNRFGKGKMNFNVPPGASVPFTIVFENLPDNLGEFSVEAVSSSPGTE